MPLLRSLREYRRFRKLPERSIVFYAESRQDWHHFRPIVELLTEKWGRRVCCVISDESKEGLPPESERLSWFHIGRGLPRIVFFQLLRCDVMVLTMMDLDNLELARSIRPVHYVYLFHSLGSTHMVDFANSYDHYDTVLCAGPHHVREIRRREELEDLPAKRLIEHGYARLEELMARRSGALPRDGGPPTVLLAPTWGKDSILEVCGERLVAILLEAGYRTIVRPHYQTLELSPGLVQGILRRFGTHPRLEYVDQMGETDSLLRSDVLISDWSAIAIEYALGLEKPVLFIDVPRRIRNPRYQELGLEPIEVWIRTEVGSVLDPARLEQAPVLIEELLGAAGRFRDRASALRERCVFNVGRSAEVAAEEIARLADARADEHAGLPQPRRGRRPAAARRP
jgi:YidC/Oxa1 family membrane protein insertase